MSNYLTPEENRALQGLPLRAQVIYLRSLRPNMDDKTQIAGSRITITLASLADETTEIINRQIQSKPSKDVIRAALDQLKRAGLIECVDDPDYLTFFLSLVSLSRDTKVKNAIENGPSYDLKPVLPIKEPPKNQKPTYGEIVTIYHEILPTLPAVYKLNDTRKRRIKALLDEELEDLDSWRNYFAHIAKSDFLMGRMPGHDGSPFMVSFDFIIHPAKFIKIAEQRYHGKNLCKKP